MVIVNYRTPDLLEKAADSFRLFYPNVDLVIVDNGSNDRSLQVIESLVESNPEVTKSILLDRNFFHGPAMDLAMSRLKREIAFFLDTDTETESGGFLELMLRELESDKRVYGVGRVDRVNRRGFADPGGTEVILITAYMMLRRKMYFDLPPFKHHGMPTLENFSAASAKGYLLNQFEIDRYIKHFGRGTASRFGYSLGLRGKLNLVLNKFGL